MKCEMCDNIVSSKVSYHVLCDECGDKRRRAYAMAYRKRQEEEE
jgi:hypothetical protein